MRSGRLVAGLCLVLAAFNLRIVFASVAPVLPEMMTATGGTPAGAALLTTLPVLCLGVFAPLAPGLAGRIGAERVLAWALALIAAGTALRAVPALPAIIGGQALAAAAIALVNVLLPSFVKRDFADRPALMTGFYALALTGGAALAAAATVPVARAAGSWQVAVSAWAAPAALVAVLWFSRPARPFVVSSPGLAARPLWRDPIAWQVTLFMGLQSALAYSIFGWLPSLVQARGTGAEAAGYALSLSIVGQMAGSVLAPHFARFAPRIAALALVALAVGGFEGLLLGPPPLASVFAVIQGFGQGALLPLALTFIILRSPDAGTAARLSGMAQGVGYGLAAGGPLLIGIIRDRTPDLSVVAWAIGGIGLACAVAGLGAGRPRLVGQVPLRPGA